jgi:hypothetical protein
MDDSEWKIRLKFEMDDFLEYHFWKPPYGNQKKIEQQCMAI